MTSSPDEGHVHLHHHPRGSLRRAVLRFAVLVVLIVGTFAAVRFTPLGDLFTAERLGGLLQRARGHWWSPLALIGLYAVLCPLGVPASPMIVVGGAIFGFGLGTFWNWLGGLIGALVSYFLARFLGREFVERIGGARVRRFEKLLSRQGWPMLIGMRFLPMPFALANSAAAVVGVRLLPFLVTTSIGLLPPMAVLTYAATALLSAAEGGRAEILRNLALVFLLFGSLVIFPVAIRRRLRKRRLRRLRAHRAARGSGARSDDRPA